MNCTLGTGRLPAMKIPICQSQWCDYRVISWPANYVLDIWPLPEFPNGNEAAQIAATWATARADGAPGLLLLGCDVAADPEDFTAMQLAVEMMPDDLHTGMVKLWPESTKRSHWIWSHRGGTLGMPAAHTDDTAPVAYVSLGCLWVPGRLLDLAAPIMAQWRWGETDVKLSELALSNGIRAHAVRGCRPKHLHFQREHDGQVIRRKAFRARASLPAD